MSNTSSSGFSLPWNTVGDSIFFVGVLLLTNVARRSWRFCVTWKKSQTISFPVASFPMINPLTLVLLVRPERYFCCVWSILRPIMLLRLCRRVMRFNMRARLSRIETSRLRRMEWLPVARNARSGIDLVQRMRHQKIYTLLIQVARASSFFRY